MKGITMFLKSGKAKVGFSVTMHDGTVVAFPAEGGGAVEVPDEAGAEVLGLVETDAEGNPVESKDDKASSKKK